MSILKYIATADTTITNAFRPLTKNRAYYANMGAADSLEIFSMPVSGSESEISRILLNFPIQEISSSRNEGRIPNQGSVSFYLKLYNATHPEMLPKNYTVVIKPISGSWDEGEGLDLDNYLDNGQKEELGYGVNWINKSTNDPKVWQSEGGDYYDLYHKTFRFEDGTEDLEVDVTDIIEAQLSGELSLDGIGVMLSGSYENGDIKKIYYTKRFSARSSEYFYNKPCIEARWETLVKDNRGSFFYESPNIIPEENVQNIFFYNKINGVLKNLPNNTLPLLKISNSLNEVLLTDINTINVSTGVYRASFSLTGSADEELYDTWYSGSNEYYKGIINFKVRNFEDSFADTNYVVSVSNLKSVYSVNEKPIIKIFAREKNWNPNLYQKFNNEMESLIFDNLYYKVYRIVDKKTIIDYGISPIAYTKCSYDKHGNYFELDMSMFEPGYGYAIKLMILNGDINAELPSIYRFKVE